MKMNKLFTGFMSVFCAATMLVVGTLAVQGMSNKQNDFSGTTNPKDPTIEEEFKPTTGQKEVWVQSNDSSTYYVRLNLSEYQEFTRAAAEKEAPSSGVYDWKLHTPNGASITDCGTSQNGEAFHTGFHWTFSSNTVYVDNYNAAADTAGMWIYDSDGWAYWSKPLSAGAKTENFLTKAVSQYSNKDYYYAIDVGMEFVDAADLPLWTGERTGQSGDQTPIKSEKIKDVFKGYTGSKPSPTYEYDVTGIATSYNVGDTVTAPTVKYRLAGSSDAWVDATGVSVNPAVIAADTTEVVVSFTTDKGTATWTQKVSVNGAAPINPDNTEYTYQVVNTKTDYVAGDAVDISKLSVQYQKKVGGGGWTTDSSATVKSAAPAKLAEGDNVVTVTYTVDGKNYTATTNITATAAAPVQPGNVIGPLGNGKYYTQPGDANTHIYEETDQQGNGTGEFIYDAEEVLKNNGASASDSKFQEIAHYTGGIVIPGGKYDPEVTVETTYFLHHSSTVWIPVYTDGVNYIHGFMQGVDNKLGGGDETAVSVLDDARTVPASQQNNWQLETDR